MRVTLITFALCLTVLGVVLIRDAGMTKRVQLENETAKNLEIVSARTDAARKELAEHNKCMTALKLCEAGRWIEPEEKRR